MDNDMLSWRHHKPEGMYPSVITEGGYIELPEECLKDEFRNDDGSLLFVLTNSMKFGRLCLYSSEAFDELKHQIDGLIQFKGIHRQLNKIIVGEAVEVSVDEKSRVKIDPQLLSHYGIDPERPTAPDRSFPFKVMLLMYPDPGKIEILLDYEQERRMGELEWSEE